MAEDSLIRVVQGKKGFVREYKLKAILGEFFDRIEKYHGVVEISDTDLESKLTASELERLYVKFPHLNPNRELPPMPTETKVAFREELVDETEYPTEETLDEVVNESFADMEASEIAAYLEANNIDFDKRKKKNKEYLLTKI